MTTTQTLTTSDGTSLSAKYQKWNISSAFRPPSVSRLRFFVLSMPGKGKTTFLLSKPRTVIIDPEDTASFGYNGKASYFCPKDGHELQAFLDFLVENANDPHRPFDHVAFDTGEKVLQFAIPYLTDELNAKYKKNIDDIREFGEGGAGWGRVNDWFQSSLNRLYMAGYGWTVNGHLKETDVKRKTATGWETATVYRSVLNPGVQACLYRDAQFIGFIRVAPTTISEPQTVTVGGKTITTTRSRTEKRWFLDLTVPETTNEPASVLVKQRLQEFMPDTIDITGHNGHKAFEDAYAAACAAAAKATLTNTGKEQ